jgi:hypothetical protein
MHTCIEKGFNSAISEKEDGKMWRLFRKAFSTVSAELCPRGILSITFGTSNFGASY